MQITRTKVLVAAAMAIPVVAGGVLIGASQFADAAAPAFPAHYAAPYLQIGGSDAADMAADMAASGDKYYTLAFLNSQSGCTPDWEDGGYSLGTFNSQIAALSKVSDPAQLKSGAEALDTYTAQKAYVAVFGYQTFPEFASDRVNFGNVVFHPLYGWDWTSLSLK